MIVQRELLSISYEIKDTAKHNATHGSTLFPFSSCGVEK
jgi:hypothetical protein